MAKHTLLIVDDESAARKLVSTLVKSHYAFVEADSRQMALEQLCAHRIDLVLLDLFLPDVEGFDFLIELKTRYPHVPVIMVTASYNVQHAVSAMRSQATDYIVKEHMADLLLPSVQRALLASQTVRQNLQFKSDNSLRSRSVFVPDCPAYRLAFDRALKAVSKGLNVLILGETGTGKDAVARYVQHHLQPDMPLVTLNCGAICNSISESELFGHESGAFTGADSAKIGKFELANGGVLFLDEIGNMPMDIQQSVLRILEDKKVVRVGGNTEIPVTFSLLCATNSELTDAIESGSFREDLYYRIAQVVIHLPALRTYPDVVLQFAEYFISLFNEQYNSRFQLTDSLRQYLLSQTWNGNIRQLKNVLQTAVALNEYPDGSEAPLHAELLAFQFQGTSISYQQRLDALEQQFILDALRANSHNTSRTADALGLKRTTLIGKMKRLGL